MLPTQLIISWGPICTVQQFLDLSVPSHSLYGKSQHEAPRKKKGTDSTSNVHKSSKKKHNEKWNAHESNKQNFSHSWLLTSLKGHSGKVLDMDFSSNGKFLATCAEDTTDDLDPGGGSESSEGNKENNPAKQQTGLTRRQKRNRVRREDDSTTMQGSNVTAKPVSKKTSKAKPRYKMNNTAVTDTYSTRKHQNLSSALRQYTRLNLSDSDLCVFLRHYMLSPEQLLTLGYPVESALYPGKAIIYKSESGTRNPGASKSGSAEHHSLSSSSHFFDVNASEFVPMNRQVVGSYCLYDSVKINSAPLISSLIQREYPRVHEDGVSVDCSAQYTNKVNNMCKETIYTTSNEVFQNTQVISHEIEKSTVIIHNVHNTTSSLDNLSQETTEGKKWSSSDEKKCVRCRRGFFMTLDGEYLTQEKCRYHWGKLQKVVRSSTALITEYTCCKGSSTSQGCTTGKLHVWNGVGVGVNGPFDGYVRTCPKKNPPSDGNFGIYALDCEMCFTTSGLELTKVTVVGADGRLVYDCLVQPENYIIDYNTRFSGITAHVLKNCGTTKTLKEVQSDLLAFINSDTILIGHGLENDLKALRIIHSTVIDTSVVFPHYYGLPYRRSLKSLVGCFLKRNIQQESSGHDSFEDARACTELMLWKVRKDFSSVFH